MNRLALWALGLAPLALPSCLDPLVSDTVPTGALLLPADATVPAASGALAARIAALDAVDAVVPLRTAFAHGAPVRFWDFGPSPTTAAPLWLLVTDAPDGPFTASGRTLAPVDHPTIFDVVPGDPGYSPFWTVFLVPVTDRWQGERVPSAAAVEAAVRAGLLEPPLRLPMAVNCPVVDPATRLEPAPGAAFVAPSRAFYRGVEVAYFSFDTVAVTAAGDLALPPAPLYRLRREGGEPLDEATRGVDMTGDGDRVDSNDLFAAAPGDAAYTGLVALWDVVVRPSYASIDSAADDATADATAAEAIFRAAGDPDPAWVVALYPAGLVHNRPLYAPAEDP